MPTITEIAPDIFRITTYVPPAGIQFSQFVIKDDQPLLMHTGLRKMFNSVKSAVGQIMDPASLRWIVSSHFEADECGSLNEWFAVAPNAVSLCSVVSSAVNMIDFANRKPQPLEDNEVIETGRHRLRFLQTPQVPHSWDAGLLFDETTATLLCSDIFHQLGDVEESIHSGVVDRARAAMEEYQKGPFAYYLPYTPWTEPTLERLANLNPKICATMHGSVYTGDCPQALRDLAQVMKEILGGG